MRYILTSVVIVGLFGTALYLRGAEPQPQHHIPQHQLQQHQLPQHRPGVTVLTRSPEVRSEKVADGTELQVRYRFAGSCSRASVVYRHEGQDRVLASTTDCRRQLRTSLLDGDGYVNEVELSGTLPVGASDVRLVLESETGTRVAPVEL